ncbi:hypothetical protein [Micromonospora sp. NPDC023888]|uniref:hypothetical protein n=1 Tax=Micromonospora sp. NPDC023888 TaxID=3155607 RepID=UPI0034105474
MNQPGPSVRLDDDELLVEDSAEFVWRQVHPQFLSDGQPSSQAFKPTPKDEGKLSVIRQSVTAEEAFEQYEHSSAGTWSVRVGEVAEAGSRVVDDSAKPETPKAHAYIDFRGFTRGQVERIAKVLRSAANAHGCQYSPPTRTTIGG